MSKKTTTSALVLLDDQELTYTQSQLPMIQAAALEQIAMVRQLQRESAARAILAGLSLLRVKASCKHGTFIPWLKGNVKGIGYAQCNFYMRLSRVFIEKSKVSKPDLLALPGDQTALQIDGAEGTARDFYSKLGAFVGEKSLSELLDKHGIKAAVKLGGKQEAEEKTESSAPVDPETLRFQSMDEISASLDRSRSLLIKENRLQHFVKHPDQVRAIVKGYRDLADEIEAAAKPLLASKE